MTPYPRRISTPIRPLGVPGNKNQKWTETKRSRKWRNQEILRAVRPWVGWIQVKDGLGPGEKYDRSTKANQPPVQLPVVPPLWWNLREYSLTKIRWICFLPFLITFPDLSLWKINTRISGCGIFSPRQLDGRPCEPKRPTAYSGFSRTASSAPQQTHGSEWNPASSNLGCLEDELTSSV